MAVLPQILIFALVLESTVALGVPGGSRNGRLQGKNALGGQPGQRGNGQTGTGVQGVGVGGNGQGTDLLTDELARKDRVGDAKEAFNAKSLKLLGDLKQALADQAAAWENVPPRQTILLTRMANEKDRMSGREANTVAEFGGIMEGLNDVITRGMEARKEVVRLEAGGQGPFKMEFDPRTPAQLENSKKGTTGKSSMEVGKDIAEIEKKIANVVLEDVQKESADKLAGLIVMAGPKVPEKEGATKPAESTVATAETSEGSEHFGLKPAPPRVDGDKQPENEDFIKASEKVKEFVGKLGKKALEDLENLEKERDGAGAGGPQAGGSGGGSPGGGTGGEQAQASPSESPPAEGGGGSGGGGSGGGGQGGDKGGGGAAGGVKFPTDSITGSGVAGGPIPPNDSSFRGGGLGSFLSSGIKAAIDKAQLFAGKFNPQQVAGSSLPVQKTSADRSLASLGISKGGAGGGGSGGVIDPAVNGLPPGEGRSAFGGPGGNNSPMGGDIGAGLGGGFDGSNGKPNSLIEVAYQTSGSVDGGGEVGINKAPKEGDIVVVGGTMKNSPQREVSSTKGEPGALFKKVNDQVAKMRKEKKLVPSRSESTV